jgi:hypothetical protein
MFEHQFFSGGYAARLFFTIFQLTDDLVTSVRAYNPHW